MPRLEKAAWWAIRPVRSRATATYRCPLCGFQLHAMSDHMLIAPEGDGSRQQSTADDKDEPPPQNA